MKFFICDDNYEFSKKLENDVLKIMPGSTITLFPTITSLLFTLEDEGESVDAIFLDIENSDGNGIDAAEKIRTRYPLIKLIYVTGYGDEYSQDIFNCPVGFEPIAFLIKPVKEKYLRLALDKIKNSTDVREKYLPITSNRTTVFVRAKDIIYISSDKRKLTIHTTGKTHTYYDTLETLLSELEGKFCRCHKSYIVNLDYISSLESQTSVCMSDNSIIPIGKAYLKEFKERLVRYKAANKKENDNV